MATSLDLCQQCPPGGGQVVRSARRVASGAVRVAFRSWRAIKLAPRPIREAIRYSVCECDSASRRRPADGTCCGAGPARPTLAAKIVAGHRIGILYWDAAIGIQDVGRLLLGASW